MADDDSAPEIATTATSADPHFLLFVLIFRARSRCTSESTYAGNADSKFASNLGKSPHGGHHMSFFRRSNQRESEYTTKITTRLLIQNYAFEPSGEPRNVYVNYPLGVLEFTLYFIKYDIELEAASRIGTFAQCRQDGGRVRLNRIIPVKLVRIQLPPMHRRTTALCALRLGTETCVWTTYSIDSVLVLFKSRNSPLAPEQECLIKTFDRNQMNREVQSVLSSHGEESREGDGHIERPPMRGVFHTCFDGHLDALIRTGFFAEDMHENVRRSTTRMSHRRQ
ncbi:uncharacterized protein BT62DRAFT_1013250 [Guyanagaster necrorhizus]|uniref:Uncharacterized protein n=1 Tax=Guyanagaster necrorhizus TaxID=856835 RepID=A0A9P7VG23_9AGAR|nr:uncharacterized protein BT62DRAFT_1013250 [Guyanagaster necrorhizus MCA 3950]KAG7439917.1 hypothetical protein BT62DRAFT_1013250 [Guyanagaster necrorhizus MCA 3950]